MEQGTQEWHDLRRTKIGASDAAVILGLSPYLSPFELWEQKMFGKHSEQNGAMSRGAALEPQARECFEKLTGIFVLPKVVIHSTYEWMMASLDGINFEGTTIVEIKCPNKEVHALAEKGIVPPHYMAQIQHQFAVTGAVKGYYFSFNGIKGALVEIFPDQKFIKDMIKEEEKFYELMVKKEPPPMTDKDYIIIEDKEFVELMAEYKDVKHELDILKDCEQVIREKLISLSKGKNAKCSKGQMTRSFSKGQVDIKLVPELIGVDLEPYRKPPCEKWRITVITNDGA
jgi:putative phage-type endonuclease